MDIQKIVTELSGERNRLDRAIAALESLSQSGHHRGRPPKVSQTKAASGLQRRRMSAAARARIAAAKKAWWARQKGKAGAKKAAPVHTKPTGRRPMSAAMRRKLSAMMKARWAQTKKAT
jgi:hypothetical protein